MPYADVSTLPGAYAAPWRRALRTSSLRTLGLAGAAVVLSAGQALDPHRRMSVCPLRAVTGIPCPLCGGTTAAVQAARLHLRAALGANPAVVAGAAVFIAAPLLVMCGLRRPVGTRRAALLAATLGAAQLWQLFRFGVLSF